VPSSDIPAATILAVMGLLILFRFHKRDSIENRPLFILSDSIGLISFSTTGTLIAMESGLNIAGVLALAFITAVGGGITRDVIINEVPFVFKTGFYGTISLLVGLAMYLLDCMEVLNFYTMAVLFPVGVALRMIAYYRKWSIPLAG
jgi:uncharacterized membrane protein YeiH